jgi:hypothetical protein
VDVQQVIPLPEAAEYQVQVRDKNRKERIARESTKDLSRYDVTINGVTEERLAKRQAVLRIVKHLCACGIAPERIAELLAWHPRPAFWSVPGKADPEKLIQQATAQGQSEGKPFDATRYFCSADDLIFANGRTHAFCNMWGRNNFPKATSTLLSAFPDKGISYKPSDT